MTSALQAVPSRHIEPEQIAHLLAGLRLYDALCQHLRLCHLALQEGRGGHHAIVKQSTNHRNPCKGCTAKPWPKAAVAVASLPQRLGSSGLALSGTSVVSRSNSPTRRRNSWWPSSPDIERHAGGADIGGIGENFRHRQHPPLGVVIVDAGMADDQRKARIVFAR